MKNSMFNHTIPWQKDKTLLVNTLSGAIDVIPSHFEYYLTNANQLQKNKITDFLFARRYLLEKEIDESLILESLYRELLALQRKNSPLKSVLITTFDCNLKCSYCWQQHNTRSLKSSTLSVEMVDAAFKAIDKLQNLLEEKSIDPPVIQIFGGEPLLTKNKELVEHVLKKCREYSYGSQVTTNGVNLEIFQEMLLEYKVDEIQVTVDGTEEAHNRRRIGSNYNSIMNSIANILSYQAAFLKLRVNVDLSNVNTLRDLADEIIDRRWYTNRKFYAYLAPLRDSSFASTDLITQRPKLLAKVLELKRLYPQIELFDMKGWDGYQPIRVLENTGRFPYPKANICDVNLNQFVFAPDGKIRLCAEEAHDQRGIIGEFYPEFSLDDNSFQRLYDHSPLDIKKCKQCTLLPICGGGCMLMEKEENFRNHYCQAVKDCFEYTLTSYLESREANCASL